MNWSEWHNTRDQRRERARLAAQARWALAHADMALVRESRTVEIAIRDSHRPMDVVRLSREDLGNGRWSRWRVADAQLRPLGATGIGKLLARLLD